MMNNKLESISYISESMIKKLMLQEQKQTFCMSEILSGKYAFHLKKEHYPGLYTLLFKSMTDDVMLGKEALDAFKGEYFFKSGYEITEIQLETVQKFAKYYQFGLKGFPQDYAKAALCYALLIQFSKPHTDLSTYFDALSCLFKTGDAYLKENTDLSHDFAKSACVFAMSHGKMRLDEEGASELSESLTQLAEKMAKKMQALCELSPKDLHPVSFHKKLYLTVESSLNSNSIELHYTRTLDIINTLKMYLSKKSNELIKKHNVAAVFIHERLKPITILLDQLKEEANEARKHVLDLYSIIHPEVEPPIVNTEKNLSFAVKDSKAMQLWYLDLKRKKEALAQEIRFWCNELPEKHSLAKNNQGREGFRLEIAQFNDKINDFHQKVQVYQKGLEERAIVHIVDKDLPWQDETLTKTKKSEHIKQHIQKTVIKPLTQGLKPLINEAFTAFNQLEVPFENGLQALVQKTLLEVEYYEETAKRRIFVDTNYISRNDSIEKVKAACEKVLDTSYLASSRLEYLLTVLVKERENTHISHLYPFGRSGFWNWGLALVKRLFNSQLEKSYQRILNAVLLNQMQNHWHLPSFDFRKAYNKQSDTCQKTYSVTRDDLHVNLIQLFSQCKSNSLVPFFKRKNANAERFITFLQENPHASQEMIRAKLDGFVTFQKSDTHFVKTSMDALDMLDAILTPQAIMYREVI